jgi:hypothetical protein
MFTLSRPLRYLTLSMLVTLGGLSGPARADDLATNEGPVGPHEPILTTVGSKRVIAFYEPHSGACGMHVVVWDSADASGASAARFRVNLGPSQTVHIDSPENKSINLQCGSYGEALALVEAGNLVTAKTAQ